MQNNPAWFEPAWPAPDSIGACITTRQGGVSVSPYDSFNIATHVGDRPQAVAANRAALRKELPSEPRWLAQNHGTRVADDATNYSAEVQADACLTAQPGAVCAVMTADCLPLLLCNAEGSEIAAVHAGWRGLAAGVIEATIGRMRSTPSRLLAYLGPAIGPTAFEVGDDVRTAFVPGHPAAADAFQRAGPRWYCDIYMLARQRLDALGVTRVFGGDACTFRDVERFYSFRRDGVTGRMASLIWIKT